MLLFNRIWQLNLLFVNGQAKVYRKLSNADTSLAISFSCESEINTVPPSGVVTISNLNLDDLNYLATNFYPESGELRKSQVELQAGYGDNLSIILFGNIHQSTPNYSTPDYSITLKVINGLEQNQANAFASFSMKGSTTLRDILGNLATTNNLSLDIDPKLTNRTLLDYSFQGSLHDALESLRSYYRDLELYIQNTALVARAKGTHQPVKYKLTSETGLLGIPQPTPIGCQVTTYLLSNLYAGDFIELESKRIPQLNAVYKVRKITHRGTSRGEEWKSRLECIHPNL